MTNPFDMANSCPEVMTIVRGGTGITHASGGHILCSLSCSDAVVQQDRRRDDRHAGLCRSGGENALA